MKYAILAVLMITLALSASDRVGGSGGSNPWAQRGTYTIVTQIAGGLATSYGLAIKDNTANSIWILNWGDMLNYEFEMDTGDPTGNSWAITGGVDPDDQAFCVYGSDGQWFMTDYASSFFSVFEENGTFLRNIDGPVGYTNLFGIGAGYGHMYVGSPNESKLAWGAYTGTETSISWSEMDYESVYGLAVYGNYLFVACGIDSDVNLFIHELAPDGTPGTTPVWSTTFFEGPVNGGIDYDGTYLYIYPQNDFIYVLDIDFTPGALEQSTWGAIKAAI
ncbi:MAG: hypothetical protein JXA64_02785 [Candidatus Fermentibacteraceae bacterium]|nr:hypothetical protein [Candidatus Fermentibacteraceae bacterium]MBN2608015.1 hypothetical protein [Candidatus Fermentibacteraceae bacterium]